MYSLRKSIVLLCSGLTLYCAAPAVVTFAANSPAPVRLYEIAVTRFERVDGQVWVRRGLLPATDGFKLVDENVTSMPVPESALGKTLVFTEAWFAFSSLGPSAVANFELRGNALQVGTLLYYEVGVREEAQASVGKLINLSTRGMVTDSERMIGGFVVDEQHRWVLIRALGPALLPLGVDNAIADPYLTLYRGNTPYYYNGDWSTRHDAGMIAQVAARVGASPLPAGSKDAALLVELPPGIYTAHVQPESGGGGVALLEFYIVPE